MQEKRIPVKGRVQRSRDRKKAVLGQIQNEMSYAPSSSEADTDQTMSPSPIIVSIGFQKEEMLLENENDEAMTDCTKT